MMVPLFLNGFTEGPNVEMPELTELTTPTAQSIHLMAIRHDLAVE